MKIQNCTHFSNCMELKWSCYFRILSKACYHQQILLACHDMHNTFERKTKINTFTKYPGEIGPRPIMHKTDSQEWDTSYYLDGDLDLFPNTGSFLQTPLTISPLSSLRSSKDDAHIGDLNFSLPSIVTYPSLQPRISHWCLSHLFSSLAFS